MDEVAALASAAAGLHEGSSISVVIPTRNRPASLSRLLASLKAERCVGEVIVVDDASDEPVVVADSTAVVIRSEQRCFVSAARNRGAAAACGQVIVFVDDDCLIQQGAIDRLADALFTDSTACMAGPVIAYALRPDTVWCAGVVRTHWLGRTRFVASGQSVTSVSPLNRERDDFPSVFAVRRDCFSSVGGFDQRTFPMHMEEADLAARLRARGWRVVLAPDAVVWHDLNPSEPLARRLHMTDRHRAAHVGRSRGRFILRHAKGLTRVTALAFWLSVLLPVYVLAALLDKGRAVSDRVAVAAAFVRGAIDGVIGR